MLKGLNPFAALTREVADRLVADHRLKREAEQRLSALLENYRALAEDPRYRAIYDELKLLLGEQLRHLVEVAATCKHCGSAANRIAVLQEVIIEPLETVWFERQQERAAEEQAQEPATVEDADA